MDEEYVFVCYNIPKWEETWAAVCKHVVNVKFQLQVAY
jgi:hypothetical protein